MTKVKIIIFDGDGTIFDSMPHCIEVFSEILERRYNIPRKESGQYLVSRVGAPLDSIYNALLEKHGKPTDSIDELVDEFYGLMKEDVPLFDDVKPALEILKSYRKFISTNVRQATVNARVKYHELENYLDGYFGTNGFKNKEAHIYEIIRICGLDVNDLNGSVVLVGDGPGDIELAKKFGIIGIGRAGTTDSYTLKKAGASYTLDSLSEVESILKKL